MAAALHSINISALCWRSGDRHFDPQTSRLSISTDTAALRLSHDCPTTPIDGPVAISAGPIATSAALSQNSTRSGVRTTHRILAFTPG